METSLFIGLFTGLLALGASMTYLMTVIVPAVAYKHAQNHGRFAGLEAAQSNPPSGKASSTGYRSVGKHALNVC